MPYNTTLIDGLGCCFDGTLVQSRLLPKFACVHPLPSLKSPRGPYDPFVLSYNKKQGIEVLAEP